MRLLLYTKISKVWLFFLSISKKNQTIKTLSYIYLDRNCFTIIAEYFMWHKQLVNNAKNKTNNPKPIFEVGGRFDRGGGVGWTAKALNQGLNWFWEIVQFNKTLNNHTKCRSLVWQVLCVISNSGIKPILIVINLHLKHGQS